MAAGLVSQVIEELCGEPDEGGHHDRSRLADTAERRATRNAAARHERAARSAPHVAFALYLARCACRGGGERWASDILSDSTQDEFRVFLKDLIAALGYANRGRQCLRIGDLDEDFVD